METTFNGINLSSRFVGEKRAAFDDGKHYPPSEDRHHVITAEYNGTKIEFDFYPSEARPNMSEEVDLLVAFDCFLEDAQSGSMSLDDFAHEYYCGCDSISEILKVFKACQQAYYDFLELMTIGDYDFYDKYRELKDLLEEEGVA